MNKIIIIVLVLFSSLTIEGINTNGSTNRIYSRIETPLYRYLNKNNITTQYWPDSDRPLGIQSVVKTSSR